MSYTITAGQVINDIALNDDYIILSDNGTANNTNITGNGYIQISGGGTANNTNIADHGYIHVSNGGSANTTTIGGNGYLLVLDGGTAAATTLNGTGSMRISDGGSANDTTVGRGANLIISSGGIATAIRENGGFVSIGAGATAIFAANDFSNVSLDYVSATVHSGTTATATTINRGGRVDVFTGGTVNATVINTDGGFLYLSSGAVANNTTVNSQASLRVYSGAAANNTTVNSGGSFYVYEGATANDTIVNETGRLNIFSGTANRTVVSSGGLADVYSTGLLNSTTVNSEGVLRVSKGGTADSTTVNSFGYMHISSGGVANETTVNSCGSMFISNAGVANIAVVNSKGYIYVSEGGVVNTTTINSKGHLLVYSGGVANETTINDSGYMYVSSGGTAIGNTLSGSGARLTVSSGGTATGKLTIGSGASVEVEDGGIVDFDLSAAAPGNPAIVNDFSLINASASAVFTLTVSASQDPGDYLLAEGAAGFDRSFTVCNVNGNCGDLSLAAPLNYAGQDYTLTLTSGALTLTIAGEPPDVTPPVKPTAVADITTPTNRNVTVSATFSDDSAQRQYSFDNANWIAYTAAIAMTDNGTLYFRGIDAAGNISDVEVCQVNNIDRIAPLAPTAAADITAPTNQNVTVFANFSDDSLQKQYSFDAYNWYAYTDAIGMINNASVFFRGIDAAGNVSDITCYTVNNIDRVAPPAPTIAADITMPTNRNVTVFAGFSADSAQQQFSFDTYNWYAYTSPIVMGANGTVFFRGIDAAGNVSAISGYSVTNIDKSLIAAPTGLSVSVKKYNTSLVWAKYPAEKGVNVSYEVMAGGSRFNTASNKLKFSNVPVGTYSFAVRAILSDGRASEWSSFVQGTVVDVTAPKAGALALAQTGAESLRIAWSAAVDNVGVARYVVNCNGQSRELSGNVLSTEFYGVAGKVNATLTAYDAAGNASKTVKKSFKMADITPPTQVVGLASAGVNNKSGGLLTWQPSADNVGVTQYLIAVAGQKVYKSKTNSVKIGKLAAGTYSFTVIALDKAKNQSPTSAVGFFTVSDVIAPKVKKLSAQVNGDSASVSWGATDESGIAKLELSLDHGAAIDVTPLGGYAFAGLSAGAHSLRLTAYDFGGNMAAKEISCTVKAPTLAAAV